MSIKNYIGILLLLASQFNLSAQKDTSYQTIRQENGDYSAPIIETPADRLFRTKVPSKWMGKLNIAQFFWFGAEYKISPAFSIGAYYGLTFHNELDYNFLDNSAVSDYLSPSLAVKSRWYHDMQKRIKTGRSANNFGGKYLALEVSMFDDLLMIKRWADRRIALRYGLQQRFLRNGYFDISIGAGITDNAYLKVFSTDQRMSAGIAVFLPKKKKSEQDGGLCDVLHCQDEQYKMLKINLYNVFNFQSTGKNYHIVLRPNIAFERKIGRSPFSIEVDFATVFNSNKFNYVSDFDRMVHSGRYADASWNATGELRWYYNMRKRMLSGRSGNNLSGAFIGAQLNRNSLIKDAVNIDAEGLMDHFGSNIFVLTGDFWTSNLVWGVQQRLLDRGFIQFKIGAGSTFGGNNYLYEASDKPLTKIGRRNELNLLADLKLGFAF